MEGVRKDDRGSGWVWFAKCGDSGNGTDRQDAVNRLRLHKTTCIKCK